jgi:hypothetical protein
MKKRSCRHYALHALFTLLDALQYFALVSLHLNSNEINILKTPEILLFQVKMVKLQTLKLIL